MLNAYLINEKLVNEWVNPISQLEPTVTHWYDSQVYAVGTTITSLEDVCITIDEVSPYQREDCLKARQSKICC